MRLFRRNAQAKRKASSQTYCQRCLNGEDSDSRTTIARRRIDKRRKRLALEAAADRSSSDPEISQGVRNFIQDLYPYTEATASTAVLAQALQNQVVAESSQPRSIAGRHKAASLQKAEPISISLIPPSDASSIRVTTPCSCPHPVPVIQKQDHQQRPKDAIVPNEQPMPSAPGSHVCSRGPPNTLLSAQRAHYERRARTNSMRASRVSKSAISAPLSNARLGHETSPIISDVTKSVSESSRVHINAEDDRNNRNRSGSPSYEHGNFRGSSRPTAPFKNSYGARDDRFPTENAAARQVTYNQAHNRNQHPSKRMSFMPGEDRCFAANGVLQGQGRNRTQPSSKRMSFYPGDNRSFTANEVLQGEVRNQTERPSVRHAKASTDNPDASTGLKRELALRRTTPREHLRESSQAKSS
ncbi:hypothetical protein EK21DRAFT_106320 [Setomelanomma holmii]|uniref:Uncharacterized protein n=1 Tax=Setomelanomma holmii TaxID=210430 RepID=A0A9P4HMF9_9PLEO|nr:hypothetical protein EK21DRAFT_106320 [Setomelanomma holmii]